MRRCLQTPEAPQVLEQLPTRDSSRICGENDRSVIPLDNQTRLFAIKFLLRKRLVSTIEEGEDAVQDAMLSAWKHRDQFQGRSDFATWFLRIAINAALAAKRPHQAVVSKNSLPLEFAQSKAAPQIKVRDMRLSRELARAVCDLAPCLRRAVLMHDVGGMAFSRIGKRLGISCSAAKAYAFKGRRKLRKILEEKRVT